MSALSARGDLTLRAGLALAVYLLFAWQLPNYHSSVGLAALLDGSVLTGLVAIGVGLTMLAGELDLSVGSMAALAGVMAVKLIGVGIVPALLLVTVLAAGFGALQGLAIWLLDINSLVLTIGTLIGLRGVALIAADETTPTIPLELLALTDGVSARLWIFSPLSVTMLAAFALAAFFASRTLWGREIYAIGGGRAEARAAGVPIRRPLVTAFATSAACAALGGGLLSIRSGSASPLGFEAVLIEAVAACLIGGVALKGGKGGFLGILIGLTALRLVVSGIASLGAPFWAQTLASGTLLVLVIVGETLSEALFRRRALARRPA